ncbi:hypothetical protein LIER_35734 [Lithospermum erythrorhizon]|uniref:Uncharacterized protein n=1 Tax=Lithospermum erythrorhizon TaxID=34254 RepID=A0AAV3NVK0_LITER
MDCQKLLSYVVSAAPASFIILSNSVFYIKLILWIFAFKIIQCSSYLVCMTLVKSGNGSTGAVSSSGNSFNSQFKLGKMRTLSGERGIMARGFGGEGLGLGLGFITGLVGC